MTRDTFLSRRPKTEAVEHAGETYHVRAMSGAERMAFGQEAGAMAEAGTAPESNIIPRVLVRTLCDADGNPILTADDAPAVMALDGLLVETLFNAAARLNGLDKASDAAAKKN